jgi:cytochrome d ubiquinol oxidase subunit II
VFFGAALGNIIRGVPLNSEGYFFEALWTTFTVVPEAGILDWFTVLMAVVSVSTLLAHGSNFIAMKTTGELYERAVKISKYTQPVVLLLSIVMFAAVTTVRPAMWDNYINHYWGFIFPITGLAGIIGMIYFRILGKDTAAFVSSCIFILGMMAGTAFGLFPYLLPSSINPKDGLTVYNSATNAYGMRIGSYWWIGGMLLAVIYFIYLFRTFRGKVTITEDSEGY